MTWRGRRHRGRVDQTSFRHLDVVEKCVFSKVPTGTVPPWLKVIVDLGSARNELGPQRHNSLWQRCQLPRVCQAIVRLLKLRPLVRVTGGGCRRKWLFREDSTLQGPPEPPSTMADIWKSARSSFASAPQAELWANLSASEATYLLLVQRATQPLSLVRHCAVGDESAGNDHALLGRTLESDSPPSSWTLDGVTRRS